jgi:hypothetical protein
MKLTHNTSFTGSELRFSERALAIPAPLVSPVMELSLFLVIKITRMLIIIEVGNIEKNVKNQYKFVHLNINNNHNLRFVIQD